jgi:hypothetical protein
VMYSIRCVNSKSEGVGLVSNTIANSPTNVVLKMVVKSLSGLVFPRITHSDSSPKLLDRNLDFAMKCKHLKTDSEVSRRPIIET